jgi:hypothetical protein
MGLIERRFQAAKVVWRLQDFGVRSRRSLQFDFGNSHESRVVNSVVASEETMRPKKPQMKGEGDLFPDLDRSDHQYEARAGAPCRWACIGVQSATVLREAFVRSLANGKALGSYAGLASSPCSSGGIDRGQGIGKTGNRRIRTVMVELAWLLTRYQPGAAQVCWFRERVGATGGVFAKVVALARKLLITLWRFVI